LSGPSPLAKPNVVSVPVNLKLTSQNRSFGAIVDVELQEKYQSIKKRRVQQLPAGSTERDYQYHLDRMNLKQHIQGVLDLFEEMKRDGIRTDVYTYNTVLDALSKRGDTELVLQYFQEMKDANVEPNLISYRNVLQAYEVAGDTDGLIEFFEKSKQEFQPDEIIYTTVIEALGKRGDIPSLRKYWGEMKEFKVPLNACAFVTVLTALGQQKGGAQEMIDFFELQKTERGAPDAISYTALLAGLLKKGDKKNFLKYWEEMKKVAPPNVLTYNTIMSLYAQKGDTATVAKYYELMKKAGVAPTLITYKNLIDCYGKDGEIETMMKFYNEMEQSGIKPDLNTQRLVKKYQQYSLR